MIADQQLELPCPQRGEEWPAEVDLILSAMESVGVSAIDRRSIRRHAYRVLAHLRLFADGPHGERWTLYTRDVSIRGIGFITPHRLPLGYGGVIELPTPQGRPVSIHCTLLRCRETANGWFEGALYFNREQWMFSPREEGDDKVTR